MVKSTQYLYGINAKELAQLSYKVALEHKIESANALLKVLFEPHHTKRDHTRITEVHKAIRFNENLLKELSC